MTKMKVSSVSLAGLCSCVIFTLILIFFVYQGFPIFTYGNPDVAVVTEVGHPKANLDNLSFSLWSLNATNLIIIGIVFLFSAIACIALLRGEK